MAIRGRKPVMSAPDTTAPAARLVRKKGFDHHHSKFIKSYRLPMFKLPPFESLNRIADDLRIPFLGTRPSREGKDNDLSQAPKTRA